MQIELRQQQADRVREALVRRAQLLQLTTHQMPRDWQAEMWQVETTIAAAVADAVVVSAHE